MGGGVRVGLEDSLYISKGELARSNADQVSKMKNILSLLSINLMTADDLQTEISKGKTNV